MTGKALWPHMCHPHHCCPKCTWVICSASFLASSGSSFSKKQPICTVLLVLVDFGFLLLSCGSLYSAQARPPHQMNQNLWGRGPNISTLKLPRCFQCATKFENHRLNCFLHNHKKEPECLSPLFSLLWAPLQKSHWLFCQHHGCIKLLIAIVIDPCPV